MKKRIYTLRHTFLIAIFMCCYGCTLPDFGYDGDGGDGDGGEILPWTTVTKLEIRPDTAAVGDTVFIKVSIKDSLATETEYRWRAPSFNFLDGVYNGVSYVTKKGENRVYFGSDVIPNEANMTDTTITRTGYVSIINSMGPSLGIDYKIKIKVKNDKNEY